MSSGNPSNKPKNYVIPFAIILAVALCAVIFAVRASVSAALASEAEQKSAAMTRTMATVLVDPFSMGEYDHMQAIVDATKKADSDVAYLIVLTPDGKAVATTDRSLKDISVTRDDFEKDALKATDYLLRPSKDGYETVMPIKTVVGPAGFIRIGMMRTSADEAAGQMLNTTLLVALAALVIGTGVFCVATKGTASGASKE